MHLARSLVVKTRRRSEMHTRLALREASVWTMMTVRHWKRSSADVYVQSPFFLRCKGIGDDEL